MRRKLRPEHIDKCLLDVGRRPWSDENIANLATTCLLSRRDVLQQQRTAGIGVDLNQPRSRVGQMKVVAEKDARSVARSHGNIRRPLDHVILVGLKGNDVLDCIDSLLHPGDLFARYEYRRFGEQVWMRFTQPVVGAGLSETRL